MAPKARNLFYIRDSGGSFTNLQLYAYRRALEEWDQIRGDYDVHGEDFHELRERCVFAIAALGLSLSQLLGQNNPTPLRTRVPSPRRLFRDVAKELDLGESLIPQFDYLYDFYDAVRHFGKSEDDSKYEKVLELDFPATARCFEIGIEIWSELINAYRRDPSNRLDDFDPRVHPPDGFEQYWPTWDE